MSENIKTRFLIICVICSVVAGITGIQMIRIQNSEAAQRLLAASETYQGVNRIIYPDRGNIYDSKGRLLAGNETSYEIGLDLNSVTNSESVASIAASVLGLDYAQVLGYAKMKPGNGNPYYVVLDDFVSKDKIAELKRLKPTTTAAWLKETKSFQVLTDWSGPRIPNVHIRKEHWLPISLASTAIWTELAGLDITVWKQLIIPNSQAGRNKFTSRMIHNVSPR